MGGLHIISDLFECKNKALLQDKRLIEKTLVETVKNTRLTVIGTCTSVYTHNSKQDHVSCVVVLAESHVAAHVYKNKKYVNLDVFVCNVLNDNTEKARVIDKRLKELFMPNRIKTQEIVRS